MGWLSGGAKAAKNGARLATTKSTVCDRCRRGTCQCRQIAAADRAAAIKNNRPRVCGTRLSSGATCHRTVCPGETCDHGGRS
jgi:hypothetical protein